MTPEELERARIHFMLLADWLEQRMSSQRAKGVQQHANDDGDCERIGHTAASSVEVHRRS